MSVTDQVSNALNNVAAQNNTIKDPEIKAEASANIQGQIVSESYARGLDRCDVEALEDRLHEIG